MRRHVLRSLGLVCVGVGLSAGALLVGMGEAAGNAICPPTNTVPAAPSCLTAFVSPHTLSAGKAAVAIGRFDNKSSSTASHLNLRLLFGDPKNLDLSGQPTPVNVSVDTSKITVVVNGAKVSATCVALATTTNISCDVGNIAGNGYAKILASFAPLSGAGSQVAVNVRATYGESGNDNPGGPNGSVNDQKTTLVSDANTVSLLAGTDTTATGQCTTFTTGTQNVSGGDATTTLKADYPATSDPFLPCTPVVAGVIQQTVVINGIAGKIAFLELPLLSGPGYATVTHDLTPVPGSGNINKLVLNEAVAPLFDFSSVVVVPPCDPTTQLAPSPAKPGFSTDSCVFSRSSLPKGGGRLVLHVVGTFLDPRYTP
jgi:hypothetical protein